MNAPISNPADCEVRGVIRFLQAENVRPSEIRQRLVAVYGEHVMNTASVRKWCNAAGACWNFIKRTVLWLCSVLSNSNLMWIHLLTSPFWSGTGISLKGARNRGWAKGTHHSSCQLGHAGYAAECLVRARLPNRLMWFWPCIVVNMWK